MNNSLYEVTVKNGGVSCICLVADATPEQIHTIDTTEGRGQLPRFKKVSNNDGYSYGNPTTDEALKTNIEGMKLADGKYFLTMCHEHFCSGWAAGSNWYGGNIVQM